MQRIIFLVFLFMSIVDCGAECSSERVDCTANNGIVIDSIPIQSVWYDSYSRINLGGVKVPFDDYYRSHSRSDTFSGYTSAAHLACAYMIANTEEGLQDLYVDKSHAMKLPYSIRKKQSDPSFFEQNYFRLHYLFDFVSSDSDSLQGVYIESVRNGASSYFTLVAQRVDHVSYKIFSNEIKSVDRLRPYIMHPDLIDLFEGVVEANDSKVLRQLNNIGFDKESGTIDSLYNAIDQRPDLSLRVLLPELNVLSHEKFWYK